MNERIVIADSSILVCLVKTKKIGSFKRIGRKDNNP